jgi:hypothetical protein
VLLDCGTNWVVHQGVFEAIQNHGLLNRRQKPLVITNKHPSAFRHDLVTL